MAAYAVAHLREINPHVEILEYLEKIQATLDRFCGRFIVHGGAIDVREGRWPGQLVIIEFPTMADARSWYTSPAYQRIVSLRTRHIASDTILVEGVGPCHDSAKLAAALKASDWLAESLAP
jgi:uncharacterized protein (DUF1330 family)